jgi:hypothetical protein
MGGKRSVKGTDPATYIRFRLDAGGMFAIVQSNAIQHECGRLCSETNISGRSLDRRLVSQLGQF